MWSAAQHHAALDVCDRTGGIPPCAAQMATSLVEHAGPSDPEMLRAFERGPIGLVASYVLAGGALTGDYRRGSPGAVHERAMTLAAQVAALAREWGVPASHVAFAYAFQHPHLAAVLFGRYVLKMNPVILLGACAGAGTATAALRAVQDESGSKLPVLGYTVPYAIGNILLTACGPVIVMLTR